MSRFVKGMVAGLAATIVLSLVMLLKLSMGILPAFDPIDMLSFIIHEKTDLPESGLTGWMAHLFIGTVVWGNFYALVVEGIPGRGYIEKGIFFSLMAWIVMMVGPIPASGAGLFASNLSPVIPIFALMMHLIWGFTLGFSYLTMTKVDK